MKYFRHEIFAIYGSSCADKNDQYWCMENWGALLVGGGVVGEHAQCYRFFFAKFHDQEYRQPI